MAPEPLQRSDNSSQQQEMKSAIVFMARRGRESMRVGDSKNSAPYVRRPLREVRRRKKTETQNKRYQNQPLDTSCYLHCRVGAGAAGVTGPLTAKLGAAAVLAHHSAAETAMMASAVHLHTCSRNTGTNETGQHAKSRGRLSRRSYDSLGGRRVVTDREHGERCAPSSRRRLPGFPRVLQQYATKLSRSP